MEQNSSGRPPADGFDSAQLRDVQSWRRSRSDRMVAGVCGGMGRALNVDPVLIRVVMAVLILSGPGVLFYAAAWMLMPDEGKDRSAAQGVLGDRVRPDHPWLWPVVIGACVFLAIAMMSSLRLGRFAPGPLVVLGLIWFFVFHRKGQSRRHTPQGHPAPGHLPGHQQGHTGSHRWSDPGRPADGSPTGAAGQPSTGSTQYDPASQYRPTSQYGAATESGSATPYWPAAPHGGAPQAAGSAAPQTGPPYDAGPASSATQRPQDRTVEPVRAVWTEDDPLGLYVDEAPATRPAAAPQQTRGRRGVKPAVVLVTGLAIAVAALAGASVPLALAIGLAALGTGMVVGGFVGRTLALLPLGFLLAAGVAAGTVFPAVPRDFAEVRYTAAPGVPITATNATYRFDAGSVELDLTKATFNAGAKVIVDGGAGDVVVKLPPNVDVTGDLSAQLGDIKALGQQRDGHNLKVGLDDLGADNKPSQQKVVLDLKLKLGSIEVVRE